MLKLTEPCLKMKNSTTTNADVTKRGKKKKTIEKLFDKLNGIGNFVFDLSSNIVIFGTKKRQTHTHRRHTKKERRV